MASKIDHIIKAIILAHQIEPLVEQFEAGTIVLADGVTEVELSPAQITELKAVGVAAIDACILELQAIKQQE